ncbi:MAG: 6-carboxytetrahydropterin synthase QueD [Phycisphaerales bacterium]|nr:6-carboxytetrahydropterin synthase QueD [Phycisphaerales bacterium]
MEIFRDFTFDAAHAISGLPDGHKCKNLHGHTYRLTVYLTGGLDPKIGWILDFAELKQIVWSNALDHLDHKNINEIAAIGSPTCERITVWIWNRLKPHLPGMTRITLREGENSGCTYAGEELIH